MPESTKNVFDQASSLNLNLILDGAYDMTTKRQGTAAQPTTKQICRHHWVIELAQDPTSRGVCRLCGEQREFSNFPHPAPEVTARRTGAPRPSQTERDKEL